MNRILLSLGLVGAGVLLASFSVGPAMSEPRMSTARFSPETLAALDPTRLAERMCGGQKRGNMLLSALARASDIATPASAGKTIPLYPDLTRSPFQVTTRATEAQQYFSQGLLLTYGFNHAGAVRSFREAQRRDPQCALCWWGEAMALGPNINAPMEERDRAAAMRALGRAMALRSGASPKERALIEALSLRYSAEARQDRAALDAAYADAMLGVARAFPDDNDVAVLAAEAAMDTSPWNYWEADKRTPIGRTGEAIRLVETVLTRDPSHVQAGHLYIHLLEASDPARAEAAADRMASPLAPSAGHLVHMPGHIYARRGRYADAIRVNIAAARADEAYIQSAGDEGLVRYAYYPHNIHFIVTSAQMAGDMKTAIREARRLRRVLDPATSAKIGWVQLIDAGPYLALAQFAEPRAILAAPAPDARLPYAVAMRHYARALAYAQKRDEKGFERELAAMATLKASDAFADLVAQAVPAPELLSLAEAVARGRFALAKGRPLDAIAHYRRAIALEEKLPYTEPSYWYQPVQQSLGAALYQAGRYPDASAAFRAALAQTPHNGWALYGLMQSEAAQGHKVEAAAAAQALDRAWAGDRRWLRMDRL